MQSTLTEVIERIKTLAEELDPVRQAFVTEQLMLLAEQLESDLEWDRLLATPESQAYLLERGREVLREYEAGETLEGDWGE